MCEGPQPVVVMAGLVPAIHVFAPARKTWMPATSAGMTEERLCHQLKSVLPAEQVGEPLLVVLVPGQDVGEVAADDPERRYRGIAFRRRDAVEDREVALAHRLVLRLFGELPVDEGACGPD